MDRQQRGNQAERLAQDFLVRKGLKRIDANYRCRSGEVDLIMQDADTLVFVEVRLRTNQKFGGALASIDHKKQHRLQLAAQHYLQKTSWQGLCRFDAIGINGEQHIEWVKNAF